MDVIDSTNDREPSEVLRWALRMFTHGRIAVCTSFQVEGLAVLDMAWRIDPQVRIFTIDTGRLPQETFDVMDQVRDHYGLDIEVYLPEPNELQPLLQKHGPNLFHRSLPLRLQCCELRKVRPLGRVLRDLDAWVTGLRRDQWSTRAGIRQVEQDLEHGGIVKVNPLASWSEDQVWAYVRANDVPCHPLYQQGYRSIGCAPCTRPVGAGESPRAGRWWWEDSAPKECGMHCAIELAGSTSGR